MGYFKFLAKFTVAHFAVMVFGEGILIVQDLKFFAWFTAFLFGLAILAEGVEILKANGSSDLWRGVVEVFSGAIFIVALSLPLFGRSHWHVHIPRGDGSLYVGCALVVLLGAWVVSLGVKTLKTNGTSDLWRAVAQVFFGASLIFATLFFARLSVTGQLTEPMNWVFAHGAFGVLVFGGACSFLAIMIFVAERLTKATNGTSEPWRGVGKMVIGTLLTAALLLFFGRFLAAGRLDGLMDWVMAHGTLGVLVFGGAVSIIGIIMIAAGMIIMFAVWKLTKPNKG